MKEIFELVNEMSPYLLLGFLLAGVMHVFVPSTLYSRYLSAGNFRSARAEQYLQPCRSTERGLRKGQLCRSL